MEYKKSSIYLLIKHKSMDLVCYKKFWNLLKINGFFVLFGDAEKEKRLQIILIIL